MAKATRRFGKLARVRPSAVARKGKVVAGALLLALTYDAAIRGTPPTLERTLAKWEHACTGILPRAAPKLFAVGVMGSLLPCKHGQAVVAPLARYGLEWWLAAHRPSQGLHPAAQ